MVFPNEFLNLEYRKQLNRKKADCGKSKNIFNKYF